MNIFLLTHEYPTESYRAGGMAQAFGKMAKGLAARGHDVRVFVPSDRDETVEDRLRITVRRFALQSRLPRRLEASLAWRCPEALGHYKAARSAWDAMRNEAKRGAPDVVMTASSEMDYLVALSGRWPVVSRFSAYWPFYVSCNFEPLYMAAPGGCLADWMRRQAVRAAAGLLAPSRAHQRIFEELAGRSVELIRTPMTIAEEPAPWPAVRAAYRLPDDFVLFVGSLQGVKGVHVLVEALPAILKAYPGLHAVFIGRDRNAPTGASMADFIRRQLGGFAGRVHLPGILEQHDAFAVVGQARVVVLPSLIDNLPNALLEALYLERVVVVTRDSGADDLIVDGENGLLAERNDVGSLERVIAAAVSMEAGPRAAMGRRAREAVMAACNPDQVAGDLESLLAKAAARRQRGRRLAPLRVAWAQARLAGALARLLTMGVPQRMVERYHRLAGRYLPDYDAATGTVREPRKPERTVMGRGGLEGVAHE